MPSWHLFCEHQELASLENGYIATQNGRQKLLGIRIQWQKGRTVSKLEKRYIWIIESRKTPFWLHACVTQATFYEDFYKTLGVIIGYYLNSCECILRASTLRDIKKFNWFLLFFSFAKETERCAPLSNQHNLVCLWNNTTKWSTERKMLSRPKMSSHLLSKCKNATVCFCPLV